MTERQENLTNSAKASLVHFYNQPVAKISLELFFSITLVILLAIFAVKPTLETIAKLNAEIAEKQELTDSLSSKLTALQSASRLYAESRDKIGLLAEAMPPSPQLLTLLKIIERIASDTNVVITSMSLSDFPEETEQLPTAINGTPKILTLNLSVVGEYNYIKDFVRAIDNSRRILSINSISFSINDEKGAKTLQVSLAINAPYYGVE